ncbi:hypothetical protein [Streptomyces sp. NRRL S-337]|uniref:hypothetical protein n=1 Tax=Streptomyces sp. NRRL S-337 TaxID=1463900 RepID=UPI001F2AE868|nr:hypothetical protein [Streptomyces sp. NRRL S-337]
MHVVDVAWIDDQTGFFLGLADEAGNGGFLLSVAGEEVPCGSCVGGVGVTQPE